jgi:signal transduction histidine kinase
VALQTMDSRVEGGGLGRVARSVLWLRRHRTPVLALTVAGIATSFLLDLAIPGYAIAGFYLVPLMLVAFMTRERMVVVAVGVLCLALTVIVMVLQERANGQNILLVSFGALAGAGLIALGYLYNRFDRLYEAERSTTGRLQLLTAQLKGLQELSVLAVDSPSSDLLRHIVVQARQFLDSDGGALFRHDALADLLKLEAAVGPPYEGTTERGHPIGPDPPSRAVLEQRVVAVPNIGAIEGHVDQGGEHADAHGDESLRWRACIAVPLVVREDLYGVLALYFRHATTFTEQDISLARSFGDQAALSIENTRLREQLEQSAVAAERLRLARDLHDAVTQSLFAARLKAETLLQRWPLESPEARQSLEDIYRLTRGALAEMRTLLLEMRPAALAQSSLDDLLQHLVEATEARTRISVKATLSGRRSLPPDVTIALYRIAQEALNNTVHHSGARRATVTLRQATGAVKLTVSDDGCGFDLSQVGPEQLGLTIMRERAEAVGASLQVDSRIGRGTAVTAAWRDGQG